MSASHDEIIARLELARAAATEAGRITLGYFRREDVEVELKADASPVTVADREAEEHLRRRIAAEFPDDGIVGEEFPEQDGRSGFRWIVDPIDGTKSFIRGVPLYGTLVGVEHQGHGVVGVVEMPALDERLYAAKGQGAWHQPGSKEPQAARVSSCARLADALFCTTSVDGFHRIGRAVAFERLRDAALLTRTWGDCYGYVLVATGRAEVMIDPQMNVWDAAAIQPIVEEAGGTFTDWQGKPTIRGGQGIATNSRVLDEVLAITVS
jgi:histidinol phosphatase-like enzyme (inositol monophosphatase family)